MVTDSHRDTVDLCIEGTRAEFAGRFDEARTLFGQAWEAAQDDYEACVAAHYVARFEDCPQEKLRWNQAALSHADAAVGDARVQLFYPSLYVNLGASYELLGNLAEARRYFELAARLGLIHHES